MIEQQSTEEHGFEFFPTEREVVHALLESDLLDLPGGIWIEPCAGTGRIIEATREVRDDVSFFVGEIDERFGPYLDRVLDKDLDHQEPFESWLESSWELPVADVAIFNAPFTLTMEFAILAMKRARTVVTLQRQAWFGSLERVPWFRDHCPDTYDLPWRPSFRPDGKKDNCEYSWYVWHEGQHDRRSGLRAMLDSPASRQLKLFGE